MRIRRLELKAFGPFTDKVLDFHGEGPGLHLIFGPNEAGKSSTLRALKAWLYGFEERTRDNFLHPNDRLLVAGLLTDGRGRELYFARRKKRKGDLLDADGNPLEASRLADLLHGIDRSAFERLFGLDHDDLVQGGTTLLQEKGGAGTSLFAAGTGIASLQGVLGELQAESDELFKGRASKPLLNAALRTFAGLKTEIGKASLSSREWKQHDKALREARQALEEERRKRGELDRERRRIERIRQSLTPLGLRRELRERLGALGDVRPLPPDFSSRRAASQDRLRSARQSLAAAEGRLQEFSAKARDIRLNVALLDQAETVAHLHQRLGEYRKGRQDLPTLEGKRVQEKTAGGNLWRKIRPELPLEQAESLRPLLRRRRGVKELGGHRPLLEQKVENTARDWRRAQGERDRIESSLQALAAPLELQRLRAVRNRAQRLGDPDREIADRFRELTRMKARFEAELQRAGLWVGTPADLLALPLPLAETVGRFLENARLEEEEKRTLDRRRAELEQELERLSREIAAIEKVGEVPTEEELAQLRETREQGWQLLRRRWLDGEDVSAESAAFEPELPLPEAYERKVTQADAVADRLRREAERVHQYAHLKAAREGVQESQSSLEARERTLAERKTEGERRWRDLWASCRIDPLPPAEMAAWLGRIEKLRLQAERIAQEEVGFQSLVAERRSVLEEIARELKGLRMPVPAGEALAPSIEAVRALIEKAEGAEAARRTLEERRGLLAGEIPSAAEEAREARQALERWREEWQEALRELGLPEKSTPGEAEDFFEALGACLDHLERAEEFRKRMAGIERDAGRLEAEVRALLQQVAPELATLPMDQAIEQVNGLLSRARVREVALNACREEIDKAEEESRRAREAQEAAEAELDELCALAGCRTPEALAEAERRWQERLRLEERLGEEEERLTQLAEGQSLAELEAQSAQVDPDGLPGRLRDLTEAWEEVHGRISELDQRVGEERKELERMDGSAEAAQKAEEAEECLAQLRRLAERYARLRVAVRVLEEEIERYRAAHQDPVLALAGGYFSELTLRRFEGLRADIGERGEPLIVGLRRGGERIGVEGMSAGTRDQLYLALRLASLEHRLEKQEAMPLIVDDILINFDEERTAATLQALTRLAAKSQVILFSHHRQVAEAAERHRAQVISLA